MGLKASHSIIAPKCKAPQRSTRSSSPVIGRLLLRSVAPRAQRARPFAALPGPSRYAGPSDQFHGALHAATDEAPGSVSRRPMDDGQDNWRRC